MLAFIAFVLVIALIAAITLFGVKKLMDFKNTLETQLKDFEEQVRQKNTLVTGKATAAAGAAQTGLDEAQKKLIAAREGYNKMVAKFNTLLEIFPISLLAKKLGLAKKELVSETGAPVTGPSGQTAAPAAAVATAPSPAPTPPTPPPAAPPTKPAA